MIWIGASDIRAADALRFIPATPENTTLVDGSPVNPKDGEGDWKWLPAEGNQGIFESYGDPKKNAPGLLITAKDLEAGRDYEVFGFFWTHGFGAAPATRDKQPFHWPASFGLGLASLTTYGGRFSPDIPWIISPGSNIGSRLGYTAVLEEKNPEIKGEANWITAVDDTRLIRARLGFSRAGKDGTLPVYADDFPDSKFCGRTRIDGIGLRMMPVGDLESVGAGKPGFLHLAVRAGDTRNMRRELAAGADVNALDEDGVTALLYPASSGDQATVHELLKAGANPNQAGQSIRSLTGAASWGDAEMVKILLEAGAEVPGRITAKSPLLYEHLDATRLHPAIAAIRAGSLGCLKLILEKNPDLNLETIVPESDPKTFKSEKSHIETLVKDTIPLLHDELTSFLINRGCKIDDPALLPACIQLGDEMANTREALLRRGAPAIREVPYPRYTGGNENQYAIEPWDALSSAVFIGDAVLMKRFLPLAKNVDARYQQSLHSLANWSGKPEIIAAVRERFPYQPVKAAKSRLEEDAMENSESARLFLPRTGARSVRNKESEGIWTLAVVPSPAAAGPAAVAEVRAANGKQWNVVDRADIDAALKEGRHAKPWEKGEHRLSELGDRFTADAILLVTHVKGENINLLRFEAVDVGSGLSVHREYIEEKTFEKEIDPMLARVHAAIDRANAGDKPLAISLLTFTADENLPLSNLLASQFRAAIEMDVDGTSGLLGVSMREIQSIAQEQALKGEGAFWAAAYTLEGGIATLPGDRIALTLRVHNLGDKTGQSADARVEGTLTEMAALASQAWRQLMETGAVRVTTSPQAKPAPAQAALEAARLAREAEWLLYCGKLRDAKLLVERAAMLGADPEKIVPMTISTLIADIPLKVSMPMDERRNYWLETRYPPALPYQQGLIDHLESLRELMGQTALLHERYGKLCYKWKRKSSDFWFALNLLSYARTAMPVHLLTQHQADEFGSFCKDLDLFSASYFKNLIQEKPDARYSVAPFDLFGNTVSLIMLDRNPELLDGMLKTFLAYIQADKIPFSILLANFSNGGPDHTKIKARFARKLSTALESCLPSYRERLRELVGFVLAKGDGVPGLARKIREDRLKTGRFPSLSSSVYLAPFHDHLRYGLSDCFQITNEGFPTRKNVILHALFHEPSKCPECIVRPGYNCHDRWDEYSSLIRIETSQNPKQELDWKKKSYLEYSRKGMQNGLLDPARTKRMNVQIEALASYDLLFGITLSEPLAKEWQKMSSPKQDQQSLKPRILVDLRGGTDLTPGIFDVSVSDVSTANRMWLRYHTYENGFCLTNGKAMPDDKISKLESCLMAIDCKTGTIEKRVNLSGFKDLLDGERPGRSSLLAHGSQFIAQNSSTLFTAVEWLSPDSPRESRGGYALFDKQTGKTRAVVKNVDIVGLKNHYRHQAACVEVFNDEYFLLVDRERRGDFSTKNDLIRMDSNGKLFPITQAGRKPELTPFDAVDRTPKAMTPMDGDLLVVSGKDHSARCDPQLQSWKIQEGTEDAKHVAVVSAMGKAYQERMKHARNVRLPDGKSDMQIKGAISPYNRVSYPGKIVVDLPGKKNKDVPLEITAPDDFKNKASFTNDAGTLADAGKGTIKPLKYDDFLRMGRIHPIVLDQTESDLIIGLRIQSRNPTSAGVESETFLPFLWTLPKSEVFRYLGISDSK